MFLVKSKEHAEGIQGFPYIAVQYHFEKNKGIEIIKREIFSILRKKKKIYKKFRFDSSVKQNKEKNPLKINSKAAE